MRNGCGKIVTVALIADTHGCLDERVAEEIGSCDVVVHAGDIGNATVLEELEPDRRQIVAVRGNNDVPSKWPSDQRAILDDLPSVYMLELPGGYLAVVHGDQQNPPSKRHHLLRQAFPDAHAVVYGHSHRLACDTGQTPWILNPGAAGRARTYGGPSCLILRARPKHWRVEAQRFAPERLTA
ncbi:MAG: metallophosphoesterase family protein [Gammaproteobacteria bacterium]